MVYCVAELRNYKQLVRLRSASFPEVESAISSVLGQGAAPAGPGVWTVRMGDEKDCSPTAVAQLAWRLREFLSLRRKDLFGYSVLIASISDERRRDETIRGLLETGDRGDQLWISPECAGILQKVLVFEPAGDLLRVIEPRRAPPVVTAVRVSEDRSWAREALIERALDLLTPRLNDSEARDVVLVHGPPGVGKSEFLRQLSFRLLRKTDTAPIRAFTVFRRRSILHPFLNSLSPQLLAATPLALTPLERAVWEETGELLKWLRGPSVWAAGPLPDRIEEDFALAYRLYLLSWVRTAEAKGAPAIFLCEGIESYHPAARRLLARLIEELMASSVGFLPLLSSTAAQTPEELVRLNVRPLYLHPLGKREIRALAGHLFSGLDLPEGLARRLRRRSGGRYLTVISYLHYLRKTGSIRTAGDGFQWGPTSQEALPDNPQAVSWYLIRSRPNDLYLLLYVLYLAAGLLDRSGLIIFLAEAGFDLSTVQRYLDDLAAFGLVAEPGSPIPRFPALRRNLETLLGTEGVELRERFISHLWSLWRDGRYNHPVLLFTFFARNGENDRALDVLAEILRRKLDENDVAGAAAFCEPDPDGVRRPAVSGPAARARLPHHHGQASLRAAAERRGRRACRPGGRRSIGHGSRRPGGR